MSHTLGAHRLGTDYVNAGTKPLPSLEFPGYGAVVSKETEQVNPIDLPAFVAVPNGNQRPGFLGVKYAPLNTAVLGPRHRAVRRFDDQGSRKATKPASRTGLDFRERRCEQPIARRPGSIQPTSSLDHHVEAFTRCIRH